MRTDLGEGHSRLRPPTVVLVVGDPVQDGIEGYLFPIGGTAAEVARRRRPYSRLRPPRVVRAATSGVVSINLAPRNSVWRRNTQRTVQWKLFPPAVVGAGIVSQRIRGRLFPTGTTATIIRQRRTIGGVSGPVVVTVVAAFVAAPVHVTLAPSHRGRTTSRLRGPAVVTQPTIASPIAVKLAAPARQGRAAHGFLGRPVVVFDTIRFFGPSTHLAYSRRGVPKSRLQPPVTAVAAQIYYGPQVHLVRIRPRRTVAVLRPPVIPPLARPVDVTLARIRPPRTRSRLAAPQVVFLAVEIYGPAVGLAYSRRGVAKPQLKPTIVPVVFAPFRGIVVQYVRTPRNATRTMAGVRAPVFIGAGIYFRPILVKLAPSRRPQAVSKLRPPTVVTQVVVQVYYGPKTPFARIRPVPVRSFLRPPVIPPVARPIDVTLAASRQGRAVYRLQPPTVVFLAVEIYGPETALAYSVRRPGTAKLKPPTVVDRRIYSGPAVHLTYSRRGAPNSTLRPPRVIDLSPQVYYLSTTFARIRPRPTTTFLSPPTDLVDQQDLGRVRVTLARIRPSRTIARLAPPVVVYLAVEIYGPTVELAYSVRKRGIAVLRPPTVVDRRVYFGPLVHLTYSRRGAPKSVLHAPTVIDVRPQTYYLAVSLAYSRRGVTRSRLKPPTVVDVRVYAGPQTTLAYSRRGTPKSVLRPPTVIDNRPQTVYLTVSLAYSLRGRPASALGPPVLVFSGEQRVYSGPEVTLAAGRRGRPIYGLRGPVAVDATPQTYFLSVTLARNKPQPVTYRLAPSAVTEALPRAERDIRVYLAYSVRGKPKSVLRKPTVIDVRPQTVYLTTWLAYSRRGVARSRLQPPTVIDRRIYFGPAAHSTYSRRGAPKSALKRPTVIDNSPQAVYLSINLTYSRRGVPRSRLEPPTVVVAAQVYYGPSVTLAYSVRGAPKSALHPPIIPPLAEPTRVTLAYSRRGLAKSELRGPTVIDLRPQTYFLSVTLVRNKPQPTTAFLRPSAVTEALPRAERELRVWLTYSVRGRPKSTLRKPVVIDLRPQVYYLAVALAYSRRGQAKSRLSFVAGVKVVYFGPSVTLAYSLRGQPKSRLTPPTVVQYFAARPTKIELTYSRRGRPVYELKPPTVVAPVLARHIAVSLAYSRRGQPKSFLTLTAVVRAAFVARPIQTHLARIKPAPTVTFLRPPTVVFPFFARKTKVSLAPQARGRTSSALLPPAVVATFVAPPVRVTLARNKPVPTAAALSAPTVVATPEPVLYPVAVTLAYSLRGKPIHFLMPPQALVFVPDQGEVCGDDEAGSEVCGDDETVVEICADEETVLSIEGMSSSGSSISGDDGTPGTVSGSDSENT